MGHCGRPCGRAWRGVDSVRLAFLSSCSLPRYFPALRFSHSSRPPTLECHAALPGAARDRSSADAGVFRAAPAGRHRADRRSHRNCSTTPACWRTTPRCPRNRPSTCRPRRISARCSTTSWPTRRCWHDKLMMETAGAQCLLLAGFFEDQMRPRHNVRWYAQLGASFFSRAAASRAVAAQGQAARRHREALRAVASTPRAAEPRTARQPYLLIPPIPPVITVNPGVENP